MSCNAITSALVAMETNSAGSVFSTHLAKQQELVHKD